MSLLVGIDGCRHGWLCVSLPREASTTPRPRARLLRHLDELDASIAALQVVAIDMPLGLPDASHPVRACDREARRVLGRRASSVFSPPGRAALACATHPVAAEANREELGRGLSVQAFHLFPKIIELDTWHATRPALHGAVHEVHPEVSFAHWRAQAAGDSSQGPAPPRPFSRSKHRIEGLEARRLLIERDWPGAIDAATADLQHLIVAEEGATPRWSRADLLDALAALWTAIRIAEGRATCYPAQPEPNDGTGAPRCITA